MIFKALKSVVNLVFVAITLMAFSAQAKTSQALKQVTQKYRSAKMVEMTVNKVIKSELLGREIPYDGKIYLSAGKFRWENKTPDETLLVFDGSTIWSVQMPPKEFGGSTQVLKGKVDKKTRSQILISSLLGKEPIEKNFKVLTEEKKDGEAKLTVEPVGSDLTIKKIDLVLDTKKKLLTQISYVDDVGNATTLKFSDVKFLNNEKKSLFKYVPPKDAQVSNL
jgi:Outer membrane lipoprotein-sorting protein